MDPQLATAATPTAHDLSPLGLFLMADWVVRSVMLLLLLSSLVVWALTMDRWGRLAALATQTHAQSAIQRLAWRLTEASLPTQAG